MASGEEDQPLSSLVKDVYKRFVELHQAGAWPAVLKIGQRRFIGVRTDMKKTLDLYDFRRMLSSTDSSNTRPPILQVVGDSGVGFDGTRIPFAQDVLSAYAEGNCLIEYGFTSFHHDTNWLVGDLIDKKPALASRVVANIVGQSIDSLEAANWAGSKDVSTFVVLYNANGVRTMFGEDTWVSDGVMSARFSDRMLCLEGGVQAFHQCANVLLSGIRITVLTNIRPLTDGTRFSAARLLLEMKRENMEPEGRRLSREYLETHAPKYGHQLAALERDIQHLQDRKVDLAQLVTDASQQ